MLIEFAGCSGTGKTTLAKRVMAELSNQKFDVAYSPDVMARATRTSWCKNERIRNLLLNFVLLPRFVRMLLTYRSLFWFSFVRIFRQGRGVVERVSRIRSAMRLLTGDSILRERTTRDQLTVVDEGVVGCIHNLFVFPYESTMPSDELICAYLNLAPLPDLLVLLDAPFDAVFERTEKRTDQPIRRGGECGRNKGFLGNGLAVFRKVSSHQAFQSQVLCIENRDNSFGGLDTLTTQIVDFVTAKINQYESA